MNAEAPPTLSRGEADHTPVDSRSFNFSIEEAELVSLFRTLSPDARVGFLNRLRRDLGPDSREYPAARAPRGSGDMNPETPSGPNYFEHEVSLLMRRMNADQQSLTLTMVERFLELDPDLPSRDEVSGHCSQEGA